VLSGILAGAAGASSSPAHAIAAEATSTAACPWLDEALPVSQRVNMLVSAMTLDQKVAEMHAFNTTSTGPYAGYEGYVPAQPSLCIPALPEQDDSQGVGTGATGVTQLPADVSLASAWDPALAYQYGVVNGAEHWGKGIPMALGPGVNIQRDPRWGRNFEMFSEDPYLSSKLIVPDTQGLQSQHVLADIKHYVAYNQETYRNTAADDDVVSDRVLHEIYMPGFDAALMQGGAASVMCSYASLNHTFGCENPSLLTQVLRNEWGYQGFVRSDGGANHSTVASANAGLDQEKGSNYWGNGQLAAAVADGQVSTATINAAVSRIFTPMFQLGLFNHPPTGKLSDTVTTPAHAAFARQVAEQGTVLLKNDAQILPLGAQTGSIAVIGPDGTTSPLTTGGGSANVTAPYQVSPLQGIQAAAPKGVSVTSYSGTDPSQAAETAKAANVAVVFASNYETEAQDLPDITLQNNQDAYIQAVAAANPNTIVVLNTGGPVAMPWLSQVKGLLEAWYPGQEDGTALADLLFGTADPGGKLPETFPASLSQVPASTPAQWPGVNGEVNYSEGLDVGYRWYDAKSITPAFPFGYGLSYTTFSFSNLSVSPGSTTSMGNVQVSATVTNTGDRAGSEVAQMYLGDPAAAGEPPRQLKGFQKVTLAPGQSTQVHFTLTPDDMSYYDSSAQSWAVPTGGYQVYVGSSSDLSDLPLHGSFQVTGTTGTRHVTMDAPQHVRAGTPVTVSATLTGGGDLTVNGAKLQLSAPSGWQVTEVRPAPAATLDPSQSLSDSWQVTAPAGAQDNTGQLTATADYQAPGGSTTSTTHSQVTVDPLVTTTVTPQSIISQPGQPSRVTVTNTNTSGYPVEVNWSAQPPSGSGITVSPASGTATLAPGDSASAPISVTAAGPGTVTVPVAATTAADGQTLPGPGAYIQDTTAYPSVAAAYDNVGITDDSNHAPGNFDGSGNSYSAQALAAAGISGGTKITERGVTFTWPDVPAGQPDNVAMSGQTIAMSGSGSTLGFLGAASFGTQSGNGTVYYTDGTSQSFTLTLPDWISATVPSSDDLVATTSYFNRTSAGPARTPSLFAAYVPLQAGKTVQAVQLPNAGGYNMHAFALAIG
jgi:beta-glucosidase